MILYPRYLVLSDIANQYHGLARPSTLVRKHAYYNWVISADNSMVHSTVH